MKFKVKFSLFAVILLGVTVILAKEQYLAERPNFVSPCKLVDANLNSCFMKNFQETLKQWKDGLPSLKSISTLDPIHVKRIVSPPISTNPLLDIKVEMLNVIMTGAGNAVIKDLIFDFPNGHIHGKVFIPKLKIKSDYIAKGRLLNLPLDGKGDGFGVVDDFDMTTDIYFKLRDEFGYTFTDITHLTLKINHVGKFHMDLKNLFNGQKELEDSTNEVINQNWREFFTVLQSPIEEVLQVVMTDRLSKLFAFIPANYFLADIPTAAEHNG